MRKFAVIALALVMSMAALQVPEAGASVVPISPWGNPPEACLEFAQFELAGDGFIETAGLPDYRVTMGFQRLNVCVNGWQSIWLFGSVDSDGVVTRRLGLPPVCLPLAPCNR